MEYIELEAWKELRKLVSGRYETIKTFSNEELHGLTSQVKRCTVSIPSNIEVECGCGSLADTLQSPYIFKQSLRITSL